MGVHGLRNIVLSIQHTDKQFGLALML